MNKEAYVKGFEEELEKMGAGYKKLLQMWSPMMRGKIPHSVYNRQSQKVLSSHMRRAGINLKDIKKFFGRTSLSDRSRIFSIMEPGARRRAISMKGMSNYVDRLRRLVKY